MMKKTHLILTTSMMLGLIACGGSGNSDQVEMSGNQNNHSTHPAIITAKFSGNAVNITKNGIDTFSKLNVSDKNILKIAGQEYLLKQPGVNARDFYVGRDSIISGEYLSYARYGIYGLRDVEDIRATVFAQGKTTQAEDMPKTGSIDYVGSAIHVTDLGADKQLDSLYGLKSKFTVNFATHTLDGAIIRSEKEGGSVLLQANIMGNTFAGSKDGTETQGGFYGAQAQELAGTYVNKEKHFTGAYGAFKRETQPQSE